MQVVVVRVISKLFTVLVTASCFMLMAPVVGAVSPDAELLQLRAEQWEIARHGERLVKIPVLRNIIKAWSVNEGHKIELQYPGGEEGELWVEELMDWMVSLGIPSHNLVAVPGSGAEDIIRFKILKVGEKRE